MWLIHFIPSERSTFFVSWGLDSNCVKTRYTVRRGAVLQTFSIRSSKRSCCCSIGRYLIQSAMNRDMLLCILVWMLAHFEAQDDAKEKSPGFRGYLRL